VSVTATVGLRQRKKAETRDRIGAAAARLFAERGFEHVTVAQVGAEAGVSAKTVFNYFPVKEGLFFAGDPPVDDGLLRAVRIRPPGRSAYEAVRAYVVAAADDGPGLVRAVRERPAGMSVYEVIQRFRARPARAAGSAEVPVAARARAFAVSPQLRAYARGEFARHEAALADLLARDTAVPPDDPLPAVAAAALLAPVRAAFAARFARLAAGAAEPEVAERVRRDLDRAYDMLAPALADYARR
jgi:AcrR family transcriptional regulator